MNLQVKVSNCHFFSDANYLLLITLQSHNQLVYHPTDLDSSKLFIPAGQIPAVIRRDSVAMVSRHPAYPEYLRQSFREVYGQSKMSDWNSVEDGEEKLGKLLIEQLLSEKERM